MPTFTCCATMAATASVITFSGLAGMVPWPSCANSTSVTACERGRLPTCVVRMRSALARTSVRFRAERIVVVVVAAQPALELAVRITAVLGVDLLRIRMIIRELADHAVRILGIDGAAVAMLQYVELRFRVTGFLQALLDAGLGLGVDIQRDVMEGRSRDGRREQSLVFLVGKLEEGQRAAVGQAEEAMAVHAFLAEQFVLLAPGGDQRQADDVLVEVPGGFQILGGVGRVMQPGWKVGGKGHGLAPRRI